ncbi:MAG: HlyC/CorC family transporter [Rhodospirillales bacterium]|nr:HlyC/CorC family transporter [Rhodospirillales bacterium]
MSESGNGAEARAGLVRRLISRLRPNADEDPGSGSDEHLLLSNIVNLRHMTAYDVMVPRADIDAVEVATGFADFLELIAKRGHSRLPVFRENLDEVLGFVHLKDAIPFASSPEGFSLEAIVRPVLIISPAVRALDLLHEMRQSRRHMALVVDEYGGIDGLVTIEDLVEEIVGEIKDEHDLEESQQLEHCEDGTILADARYPIENFEEEVGSLLSEEEREADIDTLGGLVVNLAGRVPARGELVGHDASGTTFEVVEADPRRLKSLRLRGFVPVESQSEESA